MDSDRAPASGSRRMFWIVFGTAAVLAALLAIWIRGGTGTQRGGLEAGKPAPPIKAEGWLNGSAPQPGEFEGQVLVIHAWFPDCIYCRKEAPDLVRLHDRYAEKGVRFVGLTFYGAERLPEPFGADSLPQIRQYLDETGIDWLNGYGALETLEALKAEYYPSMWVINRQGQIVWSKDSPGELTEAIEKALREQAG